MYLYENEIDFNVQNGEDVSDDTDIEMCGSKIKTSICKSRNYSRILYPQKGNCKKQVNTNDLHH